MKTKLQNLLAALGFSLALAASGADKHTHLHAPSPHGGRWLETTPHAEFVVEKDRGVTIRFFDKDLKPVPASDQTVAVMADTKEGRTKIVFEKQGDKLVSKSKLPAGDGYNLVVQYRKNAEAKPQNIRFKLELYTCGECKLAEYACTCHH